MVTNKINLYELRIQKNTKMWMSKSTLLHWRNTGIQIKAISLFSVTERYNKGKKYRTGKKEQFMKISYYEVIGKMFLWTQQCCYRYNKENLLVCDTIIPLAFILISVHRWPWLQLMNITACFHPVQGKLSGWQ